MPRKNNSFERALVDAEKRLAQALNERSQAQETLNDLAKEIPNLQRTVAALELQLNPQPEISPVTWTAAHFNSKTGEQTPASPILQAVTEEDTLPEPEGTPLTSED